LVSQLCYARFESCLQHSPWDIKLVVTVCLV
jgi:hypothetical protein